MRILMVSTTYAPDVNGQAVFCTNLARGLAKRGHQVGVVASTVNRRYSEVADQGVLVIRPATLPLSVFHPQAAVTAMVSRRAQELFDRFKPDVIHIHDHYPLSWSIARAARRRGIAVMGTNHFVPENLAPYLPSLRWMWPTWRQLLWRWMLTTYNRLDLVTVQSQACARLLAEQALRPPLDAVSCGVDLERFRIDGTVDQRAARTGFGLDPDQVLFVFVGRLDGEKGVDLLIHALAHTGRRDLQVAIAGRGKAKERLVAAARRVGVDQQVRFLGYVPDGDLPRLLNCADCFVMPSKAELLSIATLEAMACGRPVIAARARALPELVTHGQNGLLFTPDDENALARILVQFAGSPHLWPGMSRASRQRAQKHAWPRVLSRYEVIYWALRHPRRSSHTEYEQTVE